MSILAPLQEICDKCIENARTDDDEICKDQREALIEFFETYRPVEQDGRANYVNLFTQALCKYFERRITNCDGGTSVGTEVNIMFLDEIDFKKKIDLVVQGEKGRVAIEIKHTVDFNHLAAAMTEVALSINNEENFEEKRAINRRPAFTPNNELNIKYYIISAYVNGTKNRYDIEQRIIPELFNINNSINKVYICNLMFFGDDLINEEINEIANTSYGKVKKILEEIANWCNEGK